MANQFILDPLSGETIVEANAEINEAEVTRIEAVGVEVVRIRSVLTCKTRRGICVKCYGRDLARGATTNLGEAVGTIAAQSIGEPGTQLTMRTFHLGGAASRAVEQSVHTARLDGTVKLKDVITVTNRQGTLTVMNRNGEIILLDQNLRERERFKLVYRYRARGQGRRCRYQRSEPR